MDEPAICTDREPPVTLLDGHSSVSPWMTRTAPSGTPRRSEASIAHVVSWPCPNGVAPVRTSTVPSASAVTVPNSPPPPLPVIST